MVQHRVEQADRRAIQHDIVFGVTPNIADALGVVEVNERNLARRADNLELVLPSHATASTRATSLSPVP